MQEGTAIEIAKSKMKELRVGDNYLIRFRHLRLDPNEKKTLKGENHLFIFIGPETNIKIESKSGIYDMIDDGTNELQHIHRGIITVENQSATRQDAKFLQVIPIIKKEL